MSEGTAIAVPPDTSISATRASSRSLRRARSATDAPASARRRVVAAPIPLLAPVTIATVPVKWLIPLAPAGQHLVGGGLEGEAEAEQAVERGGGVAPAVEPEHELVEVG